MKRKVLVVDIGGTHVKLLISVRDQRDFASGNGVCFKGAKDRSGSRQKGSRLNHRAREGTRTPKDFLHQILSLARLPISPPWLKSLAHMEQQRSAGMCNRAQAGRRSSRADYISLRREQEWSRNDQRNDYPLSQLAVFGFNRVRLKIEKSSI